MSIRASLAVHRDIITAQGADVVRMRMTTGKARDLVDELRPGEARHDEKLKTAVAEWDAITGTPEPEEIEARANHMKAVLTAADKFWDAFEGQSVDGVEIIRRPA